jgi:tight adherence protein B
MDNPLVAILAIAGASLVVIGVLAFAIYSIRRDRSAIIDERLGRYTSEYGSQLSELLTVEEEAASQGSRALMSLKEAADSAIKERGFAKKWKTQLARADIKITPAEYLGLHFVSVAVAFLIGNVVLGSPIFAVLAAVEGFFFPRIYVARKTGKRQRDFEAQLADNLQMWVNGLRSGYSVLQAIESISKEAAEPTASEFKRVVREVQLGIPMEEAFKHLLERMPGDDLDLVITAVNIQREVGGNLAEILEVIGHTIRERIKLKGEIRVMTAQGRFTGYLIALLPVFLLGLLSLISPNYIGLMFKDRLCGWPMLGCGAALIALGTAAIQRIVDIEI